MGPIVKLGDGDLGGKATALPFLERTIRVSGLTDEFAPHTIRVPETWVLATDCFTEFVAHNGLDGCSDLQDDDQIRRRFLAGSLSAAVRQTLQLYLESHDLPLAVRSSALSEDVSYHTTAGLFSTLFVPNRGSDRLRQLEDAVKLVYASVFLRAVGRYMRKHSMPHEDERMAIALETVVGSVHGEVYYPLLAGVGQSINYFPVGQMRPEDGVVTLVLGLGRRVVSGLDGMRFCPRYPLVRPSMQSGEGVERTTQKQFDAVNLVSNAVRLSGPETETLASLDISIAEEHGTLNFVGSVWDPDAGVFYDNLFHEGQRVVTFSRLLRESLIPLPSMLRRMLEVVEEGYGQPVEVEFALDLDTSSGTAVANMVLLQARPLPTVEREVEVTMPEVSPEQRIIWTDQALGHGNLDNVRHIVFVDPDDFCLQNNGDVAHQVAMLNERLRTEQSGYMLLGPGRWGSSNRAVGIPVQFRHIDQAALVAELATPSVRLEPSQGTHFFHNMVAKSLYYLTVDVRAGHRLDLEWLRAQPDSGDCSLVKLIKADPPLSVRVDAGQRVGMLYRPL